MTRGLLIGAPASASGKTTVTLGLLRHFRNHGPAVAAIKVGPDYIDPAFHAVAGGRTCCNLDTWAMRPSTVARLVATSGVGADLILGEGAMGLFDGAADGRGSTADLARVTGWPVVLVVDVHGQAASAAATVHGFASFQPDVRVAGVIFNRVGSDKHAALLRRSCQPLAIPVLGCLPRRADLGLPNRHLGLVQAGEHPDLEGFLEMVAAFVAEHIDIDTLVGLARPANLPKGQENGGLPPLGQRIAVAQDIAFAFAYPHVLDGWRRAGAEILPFSPLADQPPPPADAIFMPGGYPELHAGVLAGNTRFRTGVLRAAESGQVIYGECGGYMVLGRGLVDAEGRRHAMLDLLPVETSFARRRLHLGYRQAELCTASPLGPAGTVFRGHEFHFATVLSGDGEPPLFRSADAGDGDLGGTGGWRGSVMGSFIHLVDGV
jgi:cobyrinic acid a,c-diamide synthase